ncbi:MAG: TIGR01777 family oxidoreductase [Gemmatimonadales bacterium]
MRVVVSGSRGLIGSALVPALERGGHAVIRMVRPPGAAGPGKVLWDPAAGWVDLDSLEGTDGFVHLSGESILGRWTAEKKRRLRDSRVGSTSLLAESLATLKRGPRVLVCASASGFYGSRGDEPLREDSARGTGFLADLCLEWEEAAASAAHTGIRVVHVRTGLVLAPDGGLLGPMLLPFQLGLGGRIGDGRAWWSWIAIDDLVEVYRFALEHETVRGAVNAVAPAPVTNAEFARTLGKVLGRPAALPVPPFALRMIFGSEAAQEAMLTSAKLTPARLQQAGFAFRFAELEPALRHVLGKS